MSGADATRVLEVATGSGAAGLASADLVLGLGPHSPATHGVLRLRLHCDGERIVAAEPLVGYLHRGAEKLFEVRDYRQALVLANRHDWTSAFGSELGLVLAVERMMGLTVPARAVWLRTLFGELQRVLSHLVFLASLDLTAAHPLPPCVTGREIVQTVLEEATGGRIHLMFNRVGGLKEDVPAGWPQRTRAATAQVRALLPEIAQLTCLSPAFRDRTRGVGVLLAETILAYGVSGPVARASGVDMDLRRDEPYLAYGELDFGSPGMPVVTRTEGDCLARAECLLEQVAVSLHIVDACLDRLPPGPIDVRLPKTVRAPEGSTYAWTENPLGLMGYYLVSRGERTPWRLAMRTASFNTVQALADLLPGVLLRDLATVLASMTFIVGDIDK